MAIRTTIIERGDSATKANQRIREWYMSGSIEVALDTYSKTGSLEAYNEALNSLPVMNILRTYTGAWSIDHIRMEVVHTESGKEERMPITAVIEHGISGEVIFHCIDAQSYFFRDNLDGSSSVLFVD